MASKKLEDAISSDEHKASYWVRRYIVSASAAIVSEVTTYPLDTVKVFRQTNVHIDYRKIRPIHMHHFFDGVFPGALRSCLYGGISMAIYPTVRRFIGASESDPFGAEISVWKKALIGATCGGAAQFLAQPTDVAKALTQFGSRKRIVLALQNEPYPPKPKIYTVWSRIIEREGWRGLWRGAVPSVQRSAIINGSWISCYDSSKHHLELWLATLKPDHIVSKQSRFRRFTEEATVIGSEANGRASYLIASQIAGLAAAVCAGPTDILKARMTTQKLMPAIGSVTDTGASQPRYRGSFDCMVQIVRTDGFLALYRGFWFSCFRGIPWNMVWFIVYEEMSRRVFGKSLI